MATDRYKAALKLVEKGLLKVHKVGDTELFCYTQDCFFGQDTWCPITKSHRGALYYKGVQVNRPFQKIFNLNEQPETELQVVLEKMKTEPYNIYDKANGHLLIVSIFPDDENEQRIVLHTKGSLDSEILDKDIPLFLERTQHSLGKVVESFPAITMMFEAVVEHDQHTLYENQVQMYGGERNTFVLLAANVFEPEEAMWVEVDYDNLVGLAYVLHTPVVKKYEESSMNGETPDQWLEHSGVEGYVIHFTKSGERVKIKTKEYWALRFQKDLHPNRIMQMFRVAGVDRLSHRLPEEIATKLSEVIIQHFDNWYIEEYVGQISKEVAAKYLDESVPLSKELKKELFTDPSIPQSQKHYISDTREGKERELYKSRGIREQFIRYFFSQESATMRETLDGQIKDIINTL